VWLITWRGFGLDTGFIHSGDLQLHTLQLQWTLSTRSSLNPTVGTALHWLTRTNSEDRLTKTNSVHCLPFFNTPATMENISPPTVGYHVTQQWKTLALLLLVIMQRNSRKHWLSYCWLPCNATILEWWPYPWNHCGYGYLVMTATSQTRHNNYKNLCYAVKRGLNSFPLMC
jgi:hypothetical protein